MDCIALHGVDDCIEPYHRTCLFCSVDLLDSSQPEQIEHAVMKSIPRLLNFHAPPDLENEVSRTSACSGCLKSVEEGHHMLRQLDKIQKKIDDISALLKVKIMEGCVRQSSNANAQYYPAVRKLTDKVRANIASYLDLGALVSTLVKPRIKKIRSSEHDARLSDTEDMTNDANWNDSDSNYETTEAKPAEQDGDGKNKERKLEISSTDDNNHDDFARTEKFSTEELDVLVKLYMERRSELKTKPTSLRRRTKIWKEIASQLSQVSKCSRTVLQCQTKIGELEAAGRLDSSPHDNVVSNSVVTVPTTRNEQGQEDEDNEEHTEDNFANSFLPEADDDQAGQNERIHGHRRNRNFEDDEVTILVSEYKKYLNRYKGITVPKAIRKAALAKIAKAVSTRSVSKFQRTAEQCRRKIRNMRHIGVLNEMMNADSTSVGTTDPDDDSGEEDPLSVDNMQESTNSDQLPKHEPTVRTRLPTFTPDEISLLVTEYKKHFDIGNEPNALEKRIMWENIARVVSTCTPFNLKRTAAQCREKIKKLRRSGVLSELMNNDSRLEYTANTDADSDSNEAMTHPHQDDDNLCHNSKLPEASDDNDPHNIKLNRESVVRPYRNPNFAPDEISILVTEYQKNLKQLSGARHSENRIIWGNIAKEVSSRSASKIGRTMEQCRLKIKNLRYCGLLHELLDDKSMLEEFAKEGDAGLASHQLNNDNSNYYKFEGSASEGVKTNREFTERRRRYPNFASDELSILVNAYRQNLELLSSTDFSDRIIVWEKIANAVSTGSSSNIPRSAEQCRNKIKSLRYSGADMEDLIDDNFVSEAAHESEPGPSHQGHDDDRETEYLQSESHLEGAQESKDGSGENTGMSKSNTGGAVYSTSNHEEQDYNDSYVLSNSFANSNRDIEVKGTRRLPNFEEDEVRILATEYKKYFSDGGTRSVRMLKRILLWKRIANAVSTRSSSKFPRTVEQCKTKLKLIRNSGFLDKFNGSGSSFSGTSTPNKNSHQATYEVALPNGVFVLKGLDIQLQRCDVRCEAVSHCLQMVQRLKCREKMKLREKLMKGQIQTKPPKIKIPVKFKCAMCPRQFTNRHILLRHQTAAHGEQSSRPSYSCPRSTEQESCYERFFSTVLLERHLKLTHRAELAYFCDQDDECGKGFYTEAALNRHKKRNHDPSLNFRCDICKKSFHLEVTYERHMRRHREKIQCEICSLTFKTGSSLQTHRAKVHGQTYPCPECNLQCSNRVALRKHFLLNHDEYGPNQIFKYVCAVPECSRRFQTPSKLKYHIQRYHSGGERNFHCDQCPTSFKCQFSLTAHLRIHAGSSKKNCPHCSQTLANSTSLKNHIKVVHEKRCGVQCEACGEGFLIRKYYLRHLSQCPASNNQQNNRKFSES